MTIVQTFFQSPSKCEGAFFDSANITLADGYVTQSTSKGEFIKRTCEDMMSHANVKIDNICGCNSMLDILSIKKGCTQGMYEGKKSAVFVACGVFDANKASVSVKPGNIKSSAWCGCSGSDALEVYHDKYLSNDCSGSMNAQSRVTIDAKGVRQRGFYNHSFPVDWTDIRGDALVSSQLPLPRGHCRVGFFLRGLFWLHTTFSLIGNFVRVDFAGQFPIPWRPTLPGGLQRSSVHH